MAYYRLRAEAEDDLYRIWQHGLLQYGEVQANAYFNNLITRFEALAKQPYLYQAVDDIREGYRRSVCRNNSIYYRIMDDQSIEIVRVLGKQDNSSL